MDRGNRRGSWNSYLDDQNKYKLTSTKQPLSDVETNLKDKLSTYRWIGVVWVPFVVRP